MLTSLISRTNAAADVLPSSALVSLGLVGGFATARSTRNRPLGGAVLAAAGVAAGTQWARRGPATATGLTVLYLAAFAGSHPLAKKVGAWPSVFGVTAVTAAAAHLFSDRRR